MEILLVAGLLILLGTALLRALLEPLRTPRMVYIPAFAAPRRPRGLGCLRIVLLLFLAGVALAGLLVAGILAVAA